MAQKTAIQAGKENLPRKDTVHHGGSKQVWGFIQVSHIKSEGAWKNLYLDPRNIFPMCYVHHLKVWHKDPTEWGKWFEVSFPEDYKYLEKAKYKHKDFNDRMTIEKLMAAAKIGYPEYFKAYNLLKASEIK